MRVFDDPELRARAKATFELNEFAERVMQQNLRRWHPEDTDREIELRFVSWLRKDPRERWDGAEPPTQASLEISPE